MALTAYWFCLMGTVQMLPIRYQKVKERDNIALKEKGISIFHCNCLDSETGANQLMDEFSFFIFNHF